jgi:hypothetical protein
MAAQACVSDDSDVTDSFVLKLYRDEKSAYSNFALGKRKVC